MFDYVEELKKREKIVEKYKNLPLADFLRCCLTECGYNLERLNNVYIDEFVQKPFVLGCFKRGEEYVIYHTNERNQVFYHTFSDASEFFNFFMINSASPAKYEDSSERKPRGK